MLRLNNAQLAIIDVQGNLARVVAESEARVQAIVKLVKGCQALELPILLTAQVPEKIGHTIPEIRELLPEAHEYLRTSFSIFADSRCREALLAAGRKQVLLAGFETHICLYQTSLDLLQAGYEPWLVTDCTSSRDLANKSVALQEARAEGAHLCSVEQAFFSLLRTAGHPQFKTLSKLIR